MKIFVAMLAIIGTARSASGDAHRKFSDGKTNFVDDFQGDQLPAFTKAKKFVFVLFHKNPPNFGKLNAVIFALASLFEQKEVFFLQVDQTAMTQEARAALGVNKSLSYVFFIYGLPKEYNLGFTVDECSKWIDQIVEADVTQISKSSDIPEVDSHYIVLANSTAYGKNPAHFKVLAKLISPVPLYVGLESGQIQTLVGPGRDTRSLFCYRKYDDQLINIPGNITLRDKTKIIHDSEFPNVLNCTQKAKHLILKQTLPVLIYYTNSSAPEHPNNHKLILDEATKHQEYFKVLVVDTLTAEEECAHFFKKFLAVRHSESVRILTTHDKIRRYNFLGILNPKHLGLFVHNFLENNLKSFKIHQHLTKGQELHGVLVANQKTYNRNIKKGHINGLYYVYSETSGRIHQDAAQLRIVRSVFRKNRKFRVYLFDHRMNDLDGHFHEKSPFVVLVLVTGQIVYFEGEIRAENLVRFVARHSPELALREPLNDPRFEDEL